MAHYISYNIFGSIFTWYNCRKSRANTCIKTWTCEGLQVLEFKTSLPLEDALVNHDKFVDCEVSLQLTISVPALSALDGRV